MTRRITWRKAGYGQRWGELLTREATTHPAKFPHGPLFRLITFGFEEGWWGRGDLVVDPMAGVGCGGILFSAAGVRWWGLELDPRYHKWGQQSLDGLREANYDLGHPQPELCLGDARDLPMYFDGECDAIVTSPPYAESLHNPGGCRSTVKTGTSHFHDPADSYGGANGQVGRLKWDAYWESMEHIYGQCLEVLKPGGIFVANVRNYCKRGKLVLLSRATGACLQRVGFEPVASIRCMMGGSGSMFRHMNKAKGLPTSDYDHFIVMRST